MGPPPADGSGAGELTVKEFCDFAYSLWVEDVVAVALIDRQASVALMAAGARDVTPIEPGEERRRFDAWLTSPIRLADAADRDQATLLNFLGVR